MLEGVSEAGAAGGDGPARGTLVGQLRGGAGSERRHQEASEAFSGLREAAVSPLDELEALLVEAPGEGVREVGEQERGGGQVQAGRATWKIEEHASIRLSSN